MKYTFTEIKDCHNADMASIIRINLEDVGLNIPGTAYYDKSLDNLSSYYSAYNFIVFEKHKILSVAF